MKHSVACTCARCITMTRRYAKVAAVSVAIELVTFPVAHYLWERMGQ